MQELIYISQLAKELGLTCEGVKKKLTRLGIELIDVPGRGRGGLVKAVRAIDLPKEFLVSKEEKDQSLSDWQRAEAAKRFALVEEVRNAFGRTLQERIEYVIRHLERLNPWLWKELGGEIPSSRTIRRYVLAYENGGYNALAPRWGGREGQTKLSLDERREIEAKYLVPHGPTIRGLWQMITSSLVRAGKARYLALDGWSSVVIEDNRTLSYSTIYRYIKKFISYPVAVAAREGEETFERLCVPKTRRDYESIRAGDIWNSDGHTANVFVINDVFENKKNEVVRPTIVVWKDVKSRKIVGYSVDVTENTQLVFNAFADAVRKNGYYLPRHILVDNGKSYKNKQSLGGDAFEGLYGRLGVGKHFAIPYNPNSKPVEAFWRTFDNYCSRSLVGYAGANPQKKPESLPKDIKSGKILKMSEFLQVVAQAIEAYNNMPHTGDGMNGRTPNQCYDEEFTFLRRLSEDEFSSIFLLRKEATVHRDGIRFMGWYYTDAEGRWAEYQKKKIIVAYNPSDFSEIYVLDERGRELFKATRLEKASWMYDAAEANSMDEYRAIMSEKKKVRQYKRKLAEIAGKKAQKTIETISSKEKTQKTLTTETVKLPWEPNC